MVIFPLILSSKMKLIPVISLINFITVGISTSMKLKAIFPLGLLSSEKEREGENEITTERREMRHNILKVFM